VTPVSTHVVVSAFAVWTPGGVWINASPLAGPAGATLAAWPEAPPLAVVHPGARRPHRQAAVLVQLGHALLSARADAGNGSPPPPDPAHTDLLVGTASGSAAADLDFFQGLQERGSGFGSPSTFVYTLATAGPAEVSLALGLRGSLATLTAGSISGLSAVARAAKHVSEGRSRACITGGVELAGPGRQALRGEPEAEIAALFLLESSPDPGRCPSLGDAELGFDPEPPANVAGRWDSPTTTLLTLASACAERSGNTLIEIAGRSREGYWARFYVRW
jgi:hypothetical protein